MLKIILSDLHIGAGGTSNPLEDFVHDETFIGLLDDLAREGDATGGEVEVILNGDAFEFWQVPALCDSETFDPGARYPGRLYRGTTELACARRMRLIIAGHRTLFDALARFIQPGPLRRTLTIIKGNHDLQLHWPGVQDVLREALHAMGDRSSCLSFVPQTLMRDGLYVEHGNQYADALSRHASFAHPENARRPTRLRETPGARIFIRAINRMERDLPWISSVKPLTALFWFLLRFRLRAALRLAWLMLPSLPTILWVHHPLTRTNRQIARQAAMDARTASSDPGVSPAAQVASRALQPSGPQPLSSLASLKALHEDCTLESDPILSRGLLEEHALHAQLVEAAARIAHRYGARLVSFGHTHIPAFVSLPEGAVYVNSGTWTWELDLRGQPAEAWRRLIREDSFAQDEYRLTYVRIDYIDSVPVPALRERMPAGVDIVAGE
ncbi:MAG: hypothetical protein R6X16_01590 [Anaerolineae bacterium]